MQASDDNIKRAFLQLQKATAGAVTSENGFGVAIAFLTTVAVLAGEIKKTNAALNVAQVDVIEEYRSSGKLQVATCLDRDGNVSLTKSNCWRHIRNCFAHGNWFYNESEVTFVEENGVKDANMPIHLNDFDRDGGPITFEAQIDMVDLLTMTEKLMLATDKHLV